MRRTPVAASVCLAAVLAVPATASHRGETAPPPLRATLAACSAGPAEAERFAVFTGSMPAGPGTRRMAIRFELQERRDGATAWTSLRAKGFGRWLRSEPGRSGFVYTKRVEGLAQGMAYRTAVAFRWYDAAGRVLRRTTRRTRVCRQPDLRPDLRVESLTILDGPDASSSRFVVSVVNEGRTAAGRFVLGLAAGGDRTREVAGLPAGERATVDVSAPRCAAGATVAVTLDVGAAVDESDEDDNRFSRPCAGR